MKPIYHPRQPPATTPATGASHHAHVGQPVAPTSTSTTQVDDGLHPAAGHFSAPRHGRRGNHRASTHRPRPPRRAPRGARSSGAGFDDLDHPPELDPTIDEAQQRLRVASMPNQPQQGNDTGQGSRDEGRRQERRTVAIRLPRTIAVLENTDARMQADVAAAARAAGSVEALAPLLRRVVIGATQPAVSSAGLALTLLQAARAWLASRPDDAVQPATLKSLREALLDSLQQADGQFQERRAAAAVWLPVFLLNLERPRTDGQREAAIARIDMVSRFLTKAHAGGKPT